mmetsp:Transcript_17650/g.53133  ORF Transcript_17650/g.53133 Transcript_17650/m.53133 type:complete len:211 (+) Transcript_17650:1157-1789(+)
MPPAVRRRITGVPRRASTERAPKCAPSQRRLMHCASGSTSTRRLLVATAPAPLPGEAVRKSSAARARWSCSRDPCRYGAEGACRGSGKRGCSQWYATKPREGFEAGRAPGRAASSVTPSWQPRRRGWPRKSCVAARPSKTCCPSVCREIQGSSPCPAASPHSRGSSARLPQRRCTEGERRNSAKVLASGVRQLSKWARTLSREKSSEFMR